MKQLIFYIIIGLATFAYSQSTVKIEKIFSSSGNVSFVPKHYRSKELFFKGKDLISEVNYAYNGWQIYDSIWYERKEDKICVNKFNAQYTESGNMKNYVLESIECNEKEFIFLNSLEIINDDYSLTASYLKDLELLLEFDPLKDDRDIFNFKEGIKPSIFSKYGIPYNENLYSFSFTINNNLIENDSFSFENYELKRSYKYNKNKLECVNITIFNKNETLNYKEQYKMDNVPKQYRSAISYK